MIGKVSMVGMAAVRAVVRDLAKANQNPRREFDLIGRRMLKMQREHFKDKAGPTGTAWPELSPATIEARRKGPGKGSPQPLRDTNELFNSLSSKATDIGAIVGTNVKYATAHQFGVMDRNIPARPFLYLTRDETDILAKMLTDPLIARHIRKHGSSSMSGGEAIA